jgi:hypothetical protein
MNWELEEEEVVKPPQNTGSVQGEEVKQDEDPKQKKKNPNKRKITELSVFSFLQYIFLPVLCGFITAGILAIAGLEKLGLDKFGFANFPTIKIGEATWSNFSGLKLSAGIGCVLGMILSRFMKFGAKLGHFDFISPPTSEDSIQIPSAKTFMMSLFRLVGVPAIVVLGAMTSLKLARLGLIPGVVDVEYELFEVTLMGVVAVAGLGCLVMYVYDMMLSTVLRMTKRK